MTPRDSMVVTAAGAVTDSYRLKLVLVFEVNFGLLAKNLYPLPAALMVRSSKVAMPFCAATRSVPLSPTEPFSDIVTKLVAEVTTAPLASCITTSIAGEMVAFTSAFEGCRAYASRTGAGDCCALAPSAVANRVRRVATKRNGSCIRRQTSTDCTALLWVSGQDRS